MSIDQTDTHPAARSNAWKWWVCGLLLLATMINYMDRLTINQTSKRIIDELGLTRKQYGDIEWAFGSAFALGALVAGWTADRWNVRWVYAASLLLWSVAGFATGFAWNLFSLMACRFALGAFESGNWPCALRTTQRILSPRQRTLGNGVLQSGAALGAVLIPQVVKLLVTGPGTWPRPFFVVGAVGSVWVVFWLVSVRQADLAFPEPKPQAAAGESAARESLGALFRDRRFWVCAVIGVTINLTWHFFRVWLPLFLQESRGYEESTVNDFTSAYYLATDAGSITAGFAALFLAGRWLPVHWSRVLVFLGCCLLTTLSLAVAVVPAGPGLVVLLLTLGFGALGLFPPFYSFTQDLTTRHQGKVVGILTCIIWAITAAMHPVVGQWIDQTKDYSIAVAVAGLFPLIGLACLLLLWRNPVHGSESAGVPQEPISAEELAKN